LNVLFHLLLKDFLRLAKRPWVVLIYMAIPVMMSWMIATVFGTGREAPEIVLHVAVLDNDKEFFTGMLRSMGNQGDAARNLKLHWVESVDEGVRLIEKRKASAFVIFPKNLTADLLDGATAIVDIYKNPAQTILPQVIEQGLDIVAVGLSELLSFMGPEVKEWVQLFDSKTLPPSWGTAMIVYKGMQKMEAAKTYLFPPIIDIQTLAAKDFIPSASREIRSATPES